MSPVQRAGRFLFTADEVMRKTEVAKPSRGREIFVENICDRIPHSPQKKILTIVSIFVYTGNFSRCTIEILELTFHIVCLGILL